MSSSDIRGVAEAIKAVLAAMGRCAALSLDDAKALAELVEAEAGAAGLSVACAAANAEAATVLLHRMPGALPASVDIAVNKAFTAAAFRMATYELGRLAQPGKPLYGIESTNCGRVVLFGGGYPILRLGAMIGGLGVSGGTVEQDMAIATRALRSFSDLTDRASEGERS